MMMMICLRKLQVASDRTGRLNPLNLTAVTPIPNEIVSRSKPKRNSSPVNTQIVGHMTLAPPPVRSDADAYFLLKPKAFSLVWAHFVLVTDGAEFPETMRPSAGLTRDGL